MPLSAGRMTSEVERLTFPALIRENFEPTSYSIPKAELLSQSNRRGFEIFFT